MAYDSPMNRKKRRGEQQHRTGGHTPVIADMLATGLNRHLAGHLQEARETYRNRSIPLEMLQPLFDGDATFVSMQTELRAGDEAALRAQGNLVMAGQLFDDFSDTAACVAALDLVISVDTSAAHLAGALGRPVWVLVPFAPDWRWLLDREDSPWYPTARLFRQGDDRRWEPVIERLKQALAQMLDANASRSFSNA